MRLIDKEKLLEQLTSLEKRNKVSSMVVDIVAMTREESAIPIEWLKRWFSFQQWMGSSMTDRIYCKASDIIEDWYIENKKREWEKENEAD